VSVQSAETLEPGIINLGIYLNYAINSLPHWNDPDEGRLNLNDTLLSSDFNAAVGVTERSDFGVSFPAVLAQTVNDTASSYGFFSSKGLSEIRANYKYRVFDGDQWKAALVATVNFNLIRNDPFSGVGAGPTKNLEAILERRFFGKLMMALNFGHRWRDPGSRSDPLVAPLRNQFIASLGASYRLSSIDTKLIAELFSSFPAGNHSTQGTRSASSAELLGGVKHDLTFRTSFQAGAGVEVIHGASSPDWRIYSGINYAFGPVFKKNGAGARRKSGGSYVGYITFDFDSAQMTGTFEETLESLVELLKADGGFSKLTVEGHTDSVGNAAYNMNLSQRRAESIRNFLLKKYSFKAEQIVAQGLGETRPEADNSSFQGRQKNRRVEFKIER